MNARARRPPRPAPSGPAAERRLAALAKALGHPARVAIVRRLLARGACICREICAGAALAQSTVSQHLRQLERAGLVVGCREGTKVSYCVDAAALAELGAHLRALGPSPRRKGTRCTP